MTRRAFCLALALQLTAMATPLPTLAASDGDRGAALSVEAFIDSLGINTRILFSGPTFSSYRNDARVIDALRYLGFRHVRDGGLALNPMQIRRLARVAQQAGIAYGFVLGSGGGLDVTSVLDTIKALLDEAPGSVAAVEGFNEINHAQFKNAWRVEFGGRMTDICNHWYQPLLEGQRALYDALKADARLKDLLVYNYSLIGFRQKMKLNGCQVDLDMDLANLTSRIGMADLGTIHAYPYRGEPTRKAYIQAIERVRVVQGDDVVISETGFSTAEQAANGPYLSVSEAAQARYLLNAAFNAFTLTSGHGRTTPNIRRTYFHELLDSAPDMPATDRELHFGFFRADGTPKPVAVAFHQLIGILTANAPPAAFDMPPPVFTLLPRVRQGEIFHTLLRGQNGAYFLAVWRESPLWDTWRNVDAFPADTIPIDIRFQQGRYDISVFAPLSSSLPLQEASSGNAFTASITDQLLLIKLTPSSTP